MASMARVKLLFRVWDRVRVIKVWVKVEFRLGLTVNFRARVCVVLVLLVVVVGLEHLLGPWLQCQVMVKIWIRVCIL